MKRGEEMVIGAKPECSDLYFCIFSDHNNKTPYILSRLMSGSLSWVSTDESLGGGGTITSEKWLEVGGKLEKWLLEKTKEFEFLMSYGRD